ncbi:MAG: hypothetical protein ABI353_04970, partial [Isosphaeraceae bacterium]
MARPRGRPKANRDESSVRIERGLAGRINLIAKHQNVTVSELLGRLLSGVVDKEYLKMVRDLEK